MKQDDFKMVKMDKELHRKLKMYALKKDKPLYKVVANACLKLLKEDNLKLEK
jgi:hypothetical protein